METIAPLIAAPVILFMLFVAPLWVALHYRSQRKINQGLSEDELSQLQQLARQAEQMRERIQTLEAILDAESPQWRGRS
jgi:phage shock protein B